MISFVAIVSCDNSGCTESGMVGVRIDMDSGCSPFGGPPCTGAIEMDDPRPVSKRWEDMGGGRVMCPACYADQFRHGGSWESTRDG